MAGIPIDKDARIVIVGAGPAGLSMAWFLAKDGYTDVTVLEKLGQVGGLCKSLTVDGMSYDLGANYLTWAYQETLAIAKAVGARTYVERPYTSIEIAEDGRSALYRPMLDAVLYNPYTKQNVSLFSFLTAAIRYLAIRAQLSSIIDRPDYLDRIHEHPELCVSFKEWLATNDVLDLATLFQFPITIMGYGELEEIPTPYALRYMSLRTFLPMVFDHPPISWVVGSWPRRFTEGFQRLWERVSWGVDVRLNVNITQITRTPERVDVRMKCLEQHLDSTRYVPIIEKFDYLVLACPLLEDVFGELGLTRNSGEEDITKNIKYNPYCMTTFWIDEMQMPEPIAPILPVAAVGKPRAVARQFQDKGNNFTQFYTLQGPDQCRDGVIREVRRLAEQLLHGKISEGRAHTFDDFIYFQHFDTERIRDGIYSRVAAMQGQDRTFYAGGATDFELVEPIVEHSKHLVAKHFTGRTS